MPAWPPVLSLAACAIVFSACGEPEARPFEPIVRADRRIAGVTAAYGRIAFVDGEVLADPTRLGVDVVRVIERDGTELLRDASVGGVRDLVLLPDAAAALEMESTIADQRVVVRPFGAAAITAVHEDVPIALAADGDRLVWIEVRATEYEASSSESGLDTAILSLTLVEADARGLVLRRTPIAVEGGIRAPFALLAPFPSPFALSATSDAIFFGWSMLASCGESEVFRIARDSGAATIVWRGRGNSNVCACDESGERERGRGLAVIEGDLFVLGSVLACGSTEPTAGFVWRRGDTLRFGVPMDRTAIQGSTIFVARETSLYSFDGSALMPSTRQAPERIQGLAIDAFGDEPERLLLAASDVLYAYVP